MFTHYAVYVVQNMSLVYCCIIKHKSCYCKGIMILMNMSRCADVYCMYRANTSSSGAAEPGSIASSLGIGSGAHSGAVSCQNSPLCPQQPGPENLLLPAVQSSHTNTLSCHKLLFQAESANKQLDNHLSIPCCQTVLCQSQSCFGLVLGNNHVLI